MRKFFCSKSNIYLAVITVLTYVISNSCAQQEKESFSVKHYGELRKVMKNNDLASQIDFTNYSSKENLYALGALENLKGELLILDGKPYRILLGNEKVEIIKDFNFKAVLAVTANVTSWKTFDIPDSIHTKNELENHVFQKAKNEGLSISSPFPFILEGVASSIKWHIIDWPEGDTEHSHEKHVTSGPHGTNSKEDVLILGFYSDKHHGIFTHHTTNMHLHFIRKDESLGGHLDDLTLGKNMKLKLPI